MSLTANYTRSQKSWPAATIRPANLRWALWLVPIGAAALCVWFAYRDFISTGPAITIYFANADGLEENNTQVRYRGANVGEVKTIHLTRDGQSVRVKVRMAGSVRQLLRSDSKFWVVRPEVSVSSLSGLDTIVSGEYIAMRPGTGAPTNTFVGSERAPMSQRPGALQISLLAASLGSLRERSPVFYRGIPVGEVTHIELAEDSRNVVIRARVWNEYAPLVRQESKFWNAGGLVVRGGLFSGVEIEAESAKTIVSGGIEFATPPESQAPAVNGAVFALSQKPEDKWKAWAPAIPVHPPNSTALDGDAPGAAESRGNGSVDSLVPRR